MADLRAHYGLPRSCLTDGSLTPRELLGLIEWLPDDSAFAASVLGGPEWRGWNPDRAMLRGIHLFTHAAVSKKPPKPIPLPESSRGETRRVSSVSALPGAVPRRKEQ